MARVRLRKRYLWVILAILLAVVLASGWLISMALQRQLTSPQLRFSFTDDPSAFHVLGAGINLEAAATKNLLADSSFEPEVRRQSLTILESAGQVLAVSAQDAARGSFGDGFFDGGQATVISRSPDGLVQKRTAGIVEYRLGRIGAFHSAGWPQNLPNDLRIRAFASRGAELLAVGDDGLILRNLNQPSPERAESPTRARLVAVTAGTDGWIAGTEEGMLITSSDGRNWHMLAELTDIRLRALAVDRKNRIVAVGDEGAVVVWDRQHQTQVRPTSSDLTDIVFDGRDFIACGRQNTVLRSANGLFWQPLSGTGPAVPETARPAGESGTAPDWLALDQQEGWLAVAGSQGKALLVDPAGTVTMLQAPGTAELIDARLLPDRQLVLVSAGGRFLISGDHGTTWSESAVPANHRCHSVILAGQDKLLCAREEGGLEVARLIAEIRLDGTAPELPDQPGDYLFLEQTEPAHKIGSVWRVAGNGSVIREEKDAAPGGGSSSLRLIAGDAADPLILSQPLPVSMTSGMKSGELIYIQAWMRQEDIPDRAVRIWLTGSFGNLGTTVQGVGGTWKSFRFSLIMPERTSAGLTQPLQLHVSINGGQLILDRLTLTRGKLPPDQAASHLEDVLGQIKPQVLRIGSVTIGAEGLPAGYWAWSTGARKAIVSQSALAQAETGLTGATSTRSAQGPAREMEQENITLGEALRLTRLVGADPWLVVDAYASESEMLNLMEYLAAPITEPYGRKRMDAGSVVPWSTAFQRIYLEITDRGGILTRDNERAEFVSRLMHTVSRSPYYHRLKSRLSFVDGMFYEEGVMLSPADFHASSLIVPPAETLYAGIDSAWAFYMDNIPRNPDRIGAGRPELIRELGNCSTSNLRLADLLELTLVDLGVGTGLVNLDLTLLSDPSAESVTGELWTSAARIAAGSARGFRLRTTRMIYGVNAELADTSQASEPNRTAASPQSGAMDASQPVRIQIHAFRDGVTTRIVLTNLTDTTGVCAFDSLLPQAKTDVHSFESTGRLLRSESMRNPRSQITVPAGGAVWIEQTAND